MTIIFLQLDQPTDILNFYESFVQKTDFNFFSLYRGPQRLDNNRRAYIADAPIYARPDLQSELFDS